MVLLSVLTALAIVLNYLESLIPIPAPIPIHIGFANIITLLCLLILSFFETFFLVVLRVILANLLRGTFGSTIFFQALAGSLLAFGAMALMLLLTKKMLVFTSLVGSIFHCLGQILVAVILVGTASVIIYLPVLLLVGLPTGILTGLISRQVVKMLKKYNYFEQFSLKKSGGGGAENRETSSSDTP
jgi:heptaprenyl diphosphate synthase